MLRGVKGIRRRSADGGFGDSSGKVGSWTKGWTLPKIEVRNIKARTSLSRNIFSSVESKSPVIEGAKVACLFTKPRLETSGQLSVM